MELISCHFREKSKNKKLINIIYLQKINARKEDDFQKMMAYCFMINNLL